MAEKLSKSAAGYRVDPGPGGCDDCMHDENGYCAIVAGDIIRWGCCDYWNKRNAPEGIGKRKAEYVIGAGPRDPILCKSCRYFDSDQHTCDKVEGKINPDDACDKWQRKER